MIVNRTADYLDVVCVYKAAIERMKFLMRQRSTADKDNIVAKISMARLELGHLLRWIHPFDEKDEKYIEVPKLLKLSKFHKYGKHGFGMENAHYEYSETCTFVFRVAWAPYVCMFIQSHQKQARTGIGLCSPYAP